MIDDHGCSEVILMIRSAISPNGNLTGMLDSKSENLGRKFVDWWTDGNRGSPHFTRDFVSAASQVLKESEK